MAADMSSQLRLCLCESDFACKCLKNNKGGIRDKLSGNSKRSGVCGGLGFRLGV